MVLLNEKDKSAFPALINGFQARCSPVASEFINYFTNNYVGRAAQCAICYRDFEHGNTDINMFAESFHNKLKAFYMERKPNKRIDDLVNLLLTIEEERLLASKKRNHIFQSTNNDIIK